MPRQPLSLRHDPADAVLLGGHHAPQPKFGRRRRPVELVAGGVALLDAHDAQGLGSVGHDAHRLAQLHQPPHQRVAVAGGDRQFVGQLAREGDAEQPRPQPAADRSFGAGHEGEGLVRHVEIVHHGRHEIARAGPRDGVLCPGLGGGDELHVEIGAQALAHELHVPEHRHGLGGGGGDDEMVLGEPRHRAVVHDDPVLAQHQPIAHPSHGQLGEGVGVDEVQELRRPRPLHVDLAQRGAVANSHGRARRLDLAVDGLAPVGLPGGGKVLRPHPVADLDEDRAALLGPVMRGRLAHGPEVLSARAPRQRPHRHRRVGRAEDRGTRLGDAFARQLGHHREPGHVGGLALVRGHAQRRVALEVLDGAHVLLVRERHVLDRHVVLKVHPGAALAGHVEERGLARGRVLGLWEVRGRGLNAEIVQRLHSPRRPALQGAVRGHDSSRRASDGLPRRQ